MNKARRKRLKEAYDKLQEAKEILSSVREDEQDSYDNLPDNFRYAEKGEQMQTYIELLEEADGYLDDANFVIEQI